MNKRGQVTVFIILGILILIIIGVSFYIYNQYYKKELEPTTITSTEIEAFKDYVEDCIIYEVDSILDPLGKQGGTLNPGLSQPYYGYNVAYLCYTDSFSACYNKKPNLIGSMEQEISNYVKQNIVSCIKLDKIRDMGFNIEAGTQDVKTTINDYNIIVTLNYPVTISKQNIMVKEDTYTKTFNSPLGKLANVAKDIIDFESDPNNTPILNFNKEAYMIKNRGRVIIQPDIVGSTRVYKLNTDNSPYIFQFATQRWVH